MKTLVTAIQKGGQGKTFLTCHLAYDFAERGLRVAVIDLDTQANASFSLQRYCKENLTAYSLMHNKQVDFLDVLRDRQNTSEDKITVFAADAKLADLENVSLEGVAATFRQALDAIDSLFDVCLIDTAPSLGRAMAAAVMGADYMISPIELEAYSLQGVDKMVAVFSNLKKINKKIQFLGMLANKVDKRRPRHVQNLEELQARFGSLLIPYTIGVRDSIAEALGTSKPVWQIKKTAAREASREVRDVANFIFDKLEF